MRPIDADSLKVRLSGCMILMPNGEKCTAKRAIDTQGTIEPEVRRGRWDEIQCFSEHGIEMASYECTSCGNDIERQRGLVPPYCEFCGAKMDGGADNG